MEGMTRARVDCNTFAAKPATQLPWITLAQAARPCADTGWERAGAQQAVEQDRTEAVYRGLSNPLWGKALFDLIASRRSIEFFLKQSFVGPVPPALIDYCYSAALHRRAALYAQRAAGTV
jgi:hypothetical protein